MIKRIEQIDAVGCFASSHSPRVQFEQLSFLYADNCYGKSTLCDIIRSLAEGNGDYILHRKSVCAQGAPLQCVKLGLLLPNENSETSLTFRDGVWNPALPNSVKVLVFDTEFNHRNVFTGLTIERQNHENITKFVLGETGVQTAKRIAELNSELRALKKALRDLERTAFTGILDIPSFLYLTVAETEDQLTKDIQTKSASIQAQEKLAEDLQKAIQRQEPKALGMDIDFDAFAGRVNACLRSTFQRVHEEATGKVREHITNRTTGVPQVQPWLQMGLGYMNGRECPYCGRLLDNSAQELIKMYKAFFDEAFDKYVREVRGELTRLAKDVTELDLSYLGSQLVQNANLSALYPELMDVDQFRTGIEALERASEQLLSILKLCEETYRQLAVTVKSKLDTKGTALHATVDPWEPGATGECFGRLRAACVEYDEIIHELVNSVRSFKEELDPEKIGQKIRGLRADVAKIEVKRRRTESQDACDEYRTKSEKASAVEQEISQLEGELEAEQTRFLSAYFESIDTLFSRLGSDGFSISCQQSRRGLLPTIQLSAKFAGVEIKPGRLKSFFSESDRRALALAVFWAQIEQLDVAERSRTIVVLDDPVTSFDEGRIDRTIRLMEAARTELRQIVILSHYPRYLKAFFDRTYTQGGVALAKIVKDHNGSHIQRADKEDFVDGPHQRMYRRIRGFVERQHAEDICRDLRVFLENEVRARYWQQIEANDLASKPFGVLLDALRDTNAISPLQRNKIEPFRLSLNPDHHIWTDRVIDDQIGLAEDVLNFIYDGL